MQVIKAPHKCFRTITLCFVCCTGVYLCSVGTWDDAVFFRLCNTNRHCYVFLSTYCMYVYPIRVYVGRWQSFVFTTSVLAVCMWFPPLHRCLLHSASPLLFLFSLMSLIVSPYCTMEFIVSTQHWTIWRCFRCCLELNSISTQVVEHKNIFRPQWSIWQGHALNQTCLLIVFLSN